MYRTHVFLVPDYGSWHPPARAGNCIPKVQSKKADISNDHGFGLLTILLFKTPGGGVAGLGWEKWASWKKGASWTPLPPGGGWAGRPGLAGRRTDYDRKPKK